MDNFLENYGWMIGLLVAIPTAVIPTPIFGREVGVTWWSYPVVVASAVLALDAAGVARTGRLFWMAMGAMNLVLVVLLFFVLDRGRIISPASSRLDRAGVARLRQATDARSTLAPGETR